MNCLRTTAVQSTGSATPFEAIVFGHFAVVFGLLTMSNNLNRDWLSDGLSFRVAAGLDEAGFHSSGVGQATTQLLTVQVA